MDVWFKTGRKMQDGTPRTVCAKTEVEEAEYIKKGWVKSDPKAKIDKVSGPGPVPGMTMTRGRGRRKKDG
jgi:hypothetical protein